MSESKTKRLEELLSEMLSIIYELGDDNEQESGEVFKPGDKVRLKDEFKEHAGESLLMSDGKCGLHGVSSDDELEIGEISRDGAKAFFEHATCPWCPVSWLEKVEEEAEEEPETLAADGLPIKAGDELWFVDDGRYEAMGVSRSAKQPFRVVKIEGMFVRANSSDEADGAEPWCIKPECLTHTQPDTWERIEEDAKKDYVEYWGCAGFGCDECPAMHDEESPYERYDVDRCSHALRLDLIRRAKALADRERCE